MNTAPDIATILLSQAGRQPYLTPRLTPLGGLAELTASGSETGKEGGGVGNGMRMA